MAFVIALVVGVLSGYFGAILPGPLNFSVIRKVQQNHAHQAFWVGIGGAFTDALFCTTIGLGVGWFGSAMSQPIVRLLLASFLTLYGLKIVIFDRRRELLSELVTSAIGPTSQEGDAVETKPHPRTFDFSVFLGALQGAANPAMFVSWTIIIAFLIAHQVIRSNAASSLGFAAGVGIGGFAWFNSIIWLFTHYANSPMMRWWKRTSVFGGGALVVLGAYFLFRTLRQM
jgi:threonine/homoserine/homoserine lactone efflux protein